MSVPDDKISNCYVRKVRRESQKDNSGSSSESHISSVICLSLSDSPLKQHIMSEKVRNRSMLHSDVFVNGGVCCGSSVVGGSGIGSSTNKKRSVIYINDALTKYTKALFSKAKEAKKQREYKYLWFNNNRILMRKVDGGKIISVR